MRILLDCTRVADPVGIELLCGEQRFTLVDVVFYRRVDGTPSRLLVWQSQCADCGTVFTTRSPLKLTSTLGRRCQIHKAPGRPVERRKTPRN